MGCESQPLFRAMSRFMPLSRQEKLVERNLQLVCMHNDALKRKPSRARATRLQNLRSEIQKNEKKLAHPRSMPTGRIAETLANECMVGKAFAWFFLHQLATLAAAELKKTGLFIVPGLARLKVKTLPQRVAGKAQLFGKEVMRKGYPSRRVMKAFPVPALKRILRCK